MTTTISFVARWDAAFGANTLVQAIAVDVVDEHIVGRVHDLTMHQHAAVGAFYSEP